MIDLDNNVTAATYDSFRQENGAYQGQIARPTSQRRHDLDLYGSRQTVHRVTSFAFTPRRAPDDSAKFLQWEVFHASHDAYRFACTMECDVASHFGIHNVERKILSGSDAGKRQV